MKQKDIHNDEELYQQFMAELKTGADEYDRIMAQQQNPAAQSRRKAISRYVAAACIILPLIGLSIYLLLDNGEQEIPMTAKIDMDTPIVISQSVELNKNDEIRKVDIIDEEKTLPMDNINKKQVIAQHVVPQATIQEQPENDIIPPTVEDEVDDKVENEEFIHSLLTEVEIRAKNEERMCREIIEEICNNAENQSNIPELSL